MTVAEQIRQRGQDEGKIMALQDILLKQLKKRFGLTSQNIEHRLRQSGPDMLDKFGESIFDFRNLKDAETWWDDYGKKGSA